jgi:Cdc6-like AAA superfamily ATPase
MVGRYRDPKGISYFGEMNYKPDEIDFNNCLNDDENNENIYIMTHRPGIGKTYSVMKYLQEKIEKDKDFRFFYFNGYIINNNIRS